MPESVPIDHLVPWSQPFLDEVNWRLHEALVQMMKSNQTVRTQALGNVVKWLETNRYTQGAREELKTWEKALRESSDPKLANWMLERSEEGNLRRSNSPFAGILSDEERLRIVQGLEAEIESAGVV